MKIGIIGGGAIGLLFGGYLGLEHNVTLMVRGERQAHTINSKGVRVELEHSSKTVNVKSIPLSEGEIVADLLIIAVKQYHLPALKDFLCSLDKGIPLMFIQNGMGHLELLETLPQRMIFVATVEHGASRLDERTVRHNGIGVTNIAVYRGDEGTAARIPITGTDFVFVHRKNYRSMLGEKLIANAVINPLTAILRANNGELVSNPHYRIILQRLFHEIIPLFPELNEKKMEQNIVEICLNTRENTSSMLKDVLNGNKTEVDAILGYLVHFAEKKKVEIPLINAFYSMIKGLEKKGG
ncbi:MAG TPA: 2-dehydropantoate 2-reductase [Bacillaceae bacterium]